MLMSGEVMLRFLGTAVGIEKSPIKILRGDNMGD